MNEQLSILLKEAVTRDGSILTISSLHIFSMNATQVFNALSSRRVTSGWNITDRCCLPLWESILRTQWTVLSSCLGSYVFFSTLIRSDLVLKPVKQQKIWMSAHSNRMAIDLVITHHGKFMATYMCIAMRSNYARDWSVVQGVRRWIGSTSQTHQKKARGKSVSRPEDKAITSDPIPDKHSTEAVATALLDPYVSEEEEAEYQGWVSCNFIYNKISMYALIDTLISAKSFLMHQLQVSVKTSKHMHWLYRQGRVKAWIIGLKIWKFRENFWYT